MVINHMNPRKTATLNIRIDPVLRDVAREAAALEHRSVANFVEVLIREHCERNGITIPDQRGVLGDREDG